MKAVNTLLYILPHSPIGSTFGILSAKTHGTAVMMNAKMVKVEEKSIATPVKKRKNLNTKSPSPSKRSPGKYAPKQVICAADLMKISPENDWVDLQVLPEELRCSSTLTTGQCFNWMVVMDNTVADKKSISSSIASSAWGTHNETQWVGVVDHMVLSLRETPTSTFYRVLYSSDKEKMTNTRQFLATYFQLDVPLTPLYKFWSQRDDRLSRIASIIPGVRIIRQNPVECLFSFICSSNNNIPRITKMLSSLRQTYGDALIQIPLRLLMEDGSVSKPLDTSMTLHSFPSIEQLQRATDDDLRDMGFGYRAKYIIGSRDILLEKGGLDYLLSLRSQKEDHVQEELLEFCGIGRKVADCVALFSLDQSEAIPVDVHVQHIASRDFDPTVLGSAKSITPTIYKKVGDLFRDRFIKYSGWAHSLLFVAELPSFRNILPSDIVEQMDEFREKRKESKAALKEDIESP